MAEFNLTERAKMINSVFSSVFITPRLLSRIYKIHGITKKQTKVMKGNSQRYPPERVEAMTTELWTQIQRLQRKRFEIF